MTERTVLIGDKPHAVSVYRLSKNVWVAVGDCMDESIRVQGRTESTAVKRWCETVRDKGN